MQGRADHVRGVAKEGRDARGDEPDSQIKSASAKK